MSALRELQLAFGDAVVNGGSVQEVLDHRPGRSARMDLYRNNYYSNMTEALRATYPVVEKLVGAEFFRHAVRRYIQRYPSTSGNLHDYGDSFSEFLSAFPPVAELPYLPDVARLEWAWHEVFHEKASHPALNLAALAAVPEGRHGELRLQFNCATRLVSSLYPVLHIWEVNQDDYLGDMQVHMDEGACHLLVIQRNRTVEIHHLGAGEHAFLQSLAVGRNLQTALTDAQKTETGFYLATALQRHFQLGTLVGWELDDDHHDFISLENNYVHIH